MSEWKMHRLGIERNDAERSAARQKAPTRGTRFSDVTFRDQVAMHLAFRLSSYIFF